MAAISKTLASVALLLLCCLVSIPWGPAVAATVDMEKIQLLQDYTCRDELLDLFDDFEPQYLPSIGLEVRLAIFAWAFDQCFLNAPFALETNRHACNQVCALIIASIAIAR